MRLLLLFVSAAALTAPLAAQPISQLPYSPSLDTTSMDLTAKPCEDFARYACGNWNKSNPIPKDQASWDVYSKLTYDNERFLWGLLEEAAKPSSDRTAAQQKVGDFYHACMDEGAVEKAGLQPIRRKLDAIQSIQSLADLSRVVIAGHMDGSGKGPCSASPPIRTSRTRRALSPSPDAVNSGCRTGITTQDRCEIGRDPRPLRRAHETRLRPAGRDGRDAAAHAGEVMAIETELAQSMLTRVEMRDPHKLFHKLSRKEFAALTPALDWDGFFSAAGLGGVAVVNVTEPAFYQALERQLHAHPIGDWQSFLRWNLIRDASPYLSSPFVNSNFEFYNKYLRGVRSSGRAGGAASAGWTAI